MTLAESTAAYRRTASPSDEDETYQSYLDSGDYGETDAAAFAFSMHGDADQADDVRTGAWPGNYTGAVYESALTDPHIWLDGLGLVPLVGEAADGLNAALYLVEGDFTNASISVVSMVPYLGSLGPARRVANNVGGDVVSSMQVVDGGQVLHTIRQADGSLIQVVELTDGQLLGGPSTLIRGDVSGAASPPNAIVDPPLTAAPSTPSPLRPDDDLIDTPQATAGATPPRPDDDLIDLNNPNREPALVGANTSPDVGASANASERTPVGTGGSGNSGSGSGSSGGSGSGNGGDGPEIGGSGADDFGNGSNLDGYENADVVVDSRSVTERLRSLTGDAKNAKWVSSNGSGSGLRRHFDKHGDGVGASSVREYDLSARETIANGRRFTYRDRSSNAPRVGYWDEATGLFTATGQTRQSPAVFSHYDVTWEELRQLPGFSNG